MLTTHPTSQLWRRVRAGVRTVAAIAFISCILVMLTPILLLAQAAADTAAAASPAISTWTDALVYLIPIFVPILLAVAKKAFYTEVKAEDGTVTVQPPKWFPKWVLPVLAPVLGMAIEYILYQAGASGATTLAGALLGALGVFLREITKPITSKLLASS